ncbi:MAG TPA: glycoside hydrolase family 92 protein, partial [Flavobacterium sp.]|nr:glycoside hydrolase family 92 protein [Flavobacterium sp.]
KLVEELVRKHFKNTPVGIPGNDDTGTMSAWVVYSMMGFYPIAPGEPKYTITKPLFDKITIQLDSKYYKKTELVIEKVTNSNG